MNWPDDYINKVICGDCLEVMKGIPDGAVDLVVTDPPYGITKCKWDNVNIFYDAIPDIISKSRGQIIFGCLKSLAPMIDKVDYKYEIIWNKIRVTNIANAKKQPLRCHETIIICGVMPYKPILITQNVTKPFGAKSCSKGENTIGKLGLDYKVGVGYPKSIIEYMSPNNLTGGGLHETQKPIKLLLYLISTYSNPNDLILDPFLGSGTTAVAAKQLGRKFIGIEIDPTYCKIAENRLKQEELFK